MTSVVVDYVLSCKMCLNLGLFGRKQVINIYIGSLTTLTALLHLNFEVRGKFDSIRFNYPDLNVHRNMLVDFSKLLDGVCFT